MAFPLDFTNAIDGETEIVAEHLNNLEAKVGLNGSTVNTSLDYLTKNATDPGHEHSPGSMVLTYHEDYLTENVSMGSGGTFYTAATITLESGTWFITGHCIVGRYNAATSFVGRIYDETNDETLATDQTFMSPYTGIYVTNLKGSALLVAGSTTTVSMQATCISSSANIYANPLWYETTNKGSYIFAWRIG